MGKRGKKQEKAKIKDKRRSARFKETGRKVSTDENADFERILEGMLRMDKIQRALERES
jgi:hypothetical protein